MTTTTTAATTNYWMMIQQIQNITMLANQMPVVQMATRQRRIVEFSALEFQRQTMEFPPPVTLVKLQKRAPRIQRMVCDCLKFSVFPRFGWNIVIVIVFCGGRKLKAGRLDGGLAAVFPIGSAGDLESEPAPAQAREVPFFRDRISSHSFLLWHLSEIITIQLYTQMKNRKE